MTEQPAGSGRGMFGKKKEGDKKIRKSKSFKRIRGLLRGDSRKKKKASKGDAAPPSKRKDEESTVYGVDVDERSVVSKQTAESSQKGASSLLDSKRAFLLKVVLLLMDPQTRRFELLQLEFDSLKALVSDVLSQIPLSVTEDALRKQNYSGICGHEGVALPRSKLLADYCKGNEVLVAIPASLPAKECARLARPILGDEKVVTMLKSSGINAGVWSMTKKNRSKTATRNVGAENEEKSSSCISSAGVVLLVLALSVVIGIGHLYVSAPIKPGNIVAPGIWLSKCGALSFLPSCENRFFSLNTEGKAYLKDANGALIWEMDGGVCQKDDEACRAGLQIDLSGYVTINGNTVRHVSTYQESDLSEWPFSEAPKLRLRKYRA